MREIATQEKIQIEEKEKKSAVVEAGKEIEKAAAKKPAAKKPTTKKSGAKKSADS